MASDFSFQDWLKNPFPISAKNLFSNMPLWMFIEFATVLEDYGSEEGFKPFKLWPKQRELCNKIDITSPEFQKALFFAKRRQTGGSETMSALITKIIITEPRAQVIVISRNEDEAEYFLSSRVKPKLANLPKVCDRNGNQLIIYPKILHNDRLYIETDLGRDGVIPGSNVSALASHPDAGSGRTVRLVVMDEAEKIEHAGRIFTSIRPTIEKNPKGQLIVLSSGQLNGTWFKHSLRRIYDKKMKGVELFFMDRWADPSADDKWWETIKTQFPTEVDAIAAYPETIEDLFLTPEGKVFPQFDDRVGGKHVRHFEINDKSECKWSFRFLTAMDPGQVHPAAFLMTLYDQYEDRLYVFDEIVHRNMTITDFGNIIKQKMDKLPIRPQRNLCDTSLFKRNGIGITEGQLLSKVTGMIFTGAYRADSSGSRQMLSMRLSEGKIVIHPRCVNTIQQLRDWVFGSNGEPVDVGDDCIDDLRYICADIRKQTPAKPKEKVQPYSSAAMELASKARKEMGIGMFSASNEVHWQAL